MKNVGFPKGLRITREDIRRKIANEDDSEFDNKLVVELRDSSVPIGECKLGRPSDDGISETDVKLLPDHWGNRYGVEIKRGLVTYLFVYTDCRGVDASPNRANIASQKMQEAVGGKRIGEGVYEFPSHMKDYTVSVPYYHYRVHRADWERKRQELLFRISGSVVSLRTTMPGDLADYERWESPDLPASKYDCPWYPYKKGLMVARRKKWLVGERKQPFSFLEIEGPQGEHLGWVNVCYRSDDPHTTEFGIDICEDTFWGQGVGTKASTLWLDYLFREYDLTRIGFGTWEGNTRMLALGNRLGFWEEARIRRGCFIDGRYWDRIKMGILREEWLARCSSRNEG
jgi:RimJ/RimL family protein N-acetyltransferase